MRPDSGASVKLEESSHPLTAPTWNPDGKSLAFGKVVAEENGRFHFEVIIQAAPQQKRVILKEPVDPTIVKNSDVASLRLVWSPDGRYLVVPVLHNTRGLAIIRGDNGHILKTLEDAHRPTWSPDGLRLAFLRGVEVESLHCLDNNFGTPRHLADLGRSLQPPVWYKQTIVVLIRLGGDDQGQDVEAPSLLLRVPLDGGKPEPIALSGDEPNGRDRTVSMTSLTLDRDSENLFYSINIPGSSSEIVWYRPRNRETYQRFNPVEYPVRIGSLSLSPSGKTLAFRAGVGDALPCIGLYQLGERVSVPLTPDDSSRVQWLMTLATGVRRSLAVTLPSVLSPAGKSVDRVSPLPVPGELPTNHQTLIPLRRFARLAKPLCNRLKEEPAPSKALRQFLEEARLLFDYLADDYFSALASLDAVEDELDSPEARFQLLSLRAQIFLGQGDVERAQETIAFMKAVDRSLTRRIETTPAGTTLTNETSPTHGWTDFLALRSKKAAELRAGNNGEAGNAQEGEVFDPQRPMAPFGPQNFGQFQVDAVPLMGGENGEFPARPDPRKPRAPGAQNSQRRRTPPPPRPLPPRRIFPQVPF